MTDKTYIMAKESGIFEKEVFLQKDNDNFHDYKLLKTTAYSKLWRVSRDGKHFLIKTTKDNFFILIFIYFCRATASLMSKD